MRLSLAILFTAIAASGTVDAYLSKRATQLDDTQIDPRSLLDMATMDNGHVFKRDDGTMYIKRGGE
jgi:hypothetical protein